MHLLTEKWLIPTPLAFGYVNRYSISSVQISLMEIVLDSSPTTSAACTGCIALLYLWSKFLYCAQRHAGQKRNNKDDGGRCSQIN